MSNALFKWRLESAQKYDDSERSLGDVLDVKSQRGAGGCDIFSWCLWTAHHGARTEPVMEQSPVVD